MVPCPWAREAASRYRGEDVGVHLTLNAEHDLYRWGPITHAPSLLDGDGGFPRTPRRPLGPRRPRRGPARAAGPRSSGPSCGASTSATSTATWATLQLKPEFFDVYLDLAVEFGLPIRLPGASTERTVGFPFRELAAEEGVVFPDHFVYVRGAGGAGLHRAGALRPRTGRDRDPRPPGGRHARAAGLDARLGRPGRRPRPGRQRPQPAHAARPGRGPPASATASCATFSAPAEPPAAPPGRPAWPSAPAAAAARRGRRPPWRAPA